MMAWSYHVRSRSRTSRLCNGYSSGRRFMHACGEGGGGWVRGETCARLRWVRARGMLPSFTNPVAIARATGTLSGCCFAISTSACSASSVAPSSGMTRLRLWYMTCMHAHTHAPRCGHVYMPCVLWVCVHAETRRTQRAASPTL